MLYIRTSKTAMGRPREDGSPIGRERKRSVEFMAVLSYAGGLTERLRALYVMCQDSISEPFTGRGAFVVRRIWNV